MTDFDIYTNRVPFGLLTDDEQAALMAHDGIFEYYDGRGWNETTYPSWHPSTIYRAVREPVETVTERHMWLSKKGALYTSLATDTPVTVRITRRDGEFVRGEVLPRETEGEE